MSDQASPMGLAYAKAGIHDLQDCVSLEHALFPHQPKEELEPDVRHALGSPEQAYIVCRDGAQAVGYVNVALRRDYVEGADSSPVGYLEAIYVDPAYRGRGIARELARRAEAWALERGCSEMGSDAELDNVDSQAFHARIGYAEANRNVHFIRKIGR